MKNRERILLVGLDGKTSPYSLYVSAEALAQTSKAAEGVMVMLGTKPVPWSPKTGHLEREVNYLEMPAALQAWAARSAKTPPDLLALLATTQSIHTLANVAKNKKTPPSILATLGKHKSFAVRRKVAGNHSTPDGTLFELARDKTSTVRLEVAKNRAIPLYVAAQLVHDPHEVVRRNLAWVTNHVVVLEDLSRDKTASVRVAVVNNMGPILSANVLNRDKGFLSAEDLARVDDLLLRLSDDESRAVITQLIYKRIPQNIIKKIYDKGTMEQRMLIGIHHGVHK